MQHEHRSVAQDYQQEQEHREQVVLQLENLQELQTKEGHVSQLDKAQDVGHKLVTQNIADVAAVNEVYATYFPGNAPARRVVGVSALPKDALIQIDAVVSNAEGTAP